MSFWGCNRRKEADRTVVTIDGYQEVPQNEEALLQAVTHQPISVRDRMQNMVHSSSHKQQHFKLRTSVYGISHLIVVHCCRLASVPHRL